MVFSSVIFLFFFLPAVLAACYAVPRRFQNAVLLAASLLFYAWGEIRFLFVMLVSILINWGLGLLMDATKGTPRRRWAFFLAVAANLGILGWYKYAGFLVTNLNLLLHRFGVTPLDTPTIELPLGISFFTFQCMSYVIDVGRGEGSVQKSPLNVALYISLFPQLIAGPIVRYRDVAEQMTQRVLSIPGFAAGIRRFVIGLGKKVLIANVVAVPADAIFALPVSELTTSAAWLAVVAYALQIYFDFSGYSDMAVGLGLMFGFRFVENFDHPYISRSITEFWRRWHISLSTWFRDYLYIPLGGNRLGPARTYANLLVTFLLCGLWHGASWTFVIWGLFHGFFLIMERLTGNRLQIARPVRHLYTLLTVLVGWVFFRAETLQQAGSFLKTMVGVTPVGLGARDLARFGSTEIFIVIGVGCMASMPVVTILRERLRSWQMEDRHGWRRLADATLPFVGDASLLAVFALSAAAVASQTYNPFIYFRF